LIFFLVCFGRFLSFARKHEEMFTSTLKQCLPAETDEKCKTFVPESTERIGVITPPGTVAISLLKLINTVVANGKKEDGSGVQKIEIIPTSHIPPYGYGKTHGYTRLIRIVPQPLLVGATDTLLQSVEQNDGLVTTHGIQLKDLKAALRQQVRYHCRLNHIAAHTALWTLGEKDNYGVR
jgi:hypothetical protein